MRNREYLLTVHRYFEKQKFDRDEYNRLRAEIATAEVDLQRLRDPLQLQLPISQLLAKPHPPTPDYANEGDKAL